jgi:hypothetical protein
VSRLSLIRRRPSCFVTHAWSLALIAIACNADSLVPMISLKRRISRSRSRASDIPAIPKTAQDLTLEPRDYKLGAAPASPHPTTNRNTSPQSTIYPQRIPHLAIGATCCPIPWAAASRPFGNNSCILSIYVRTSWGIDQVAVRPISEVHLRLSLARPIALDPILTVREARRFNLININGRLKLANADRERRSLIQRPGQRLCRRD